MIDLPVWGWFLVYLMPGLWCLWESRGAEPRSNDPVAQFIGIAFTLFLWPGFLILVFVDIWKGKT